VQSFSRDSAQRSVAANAIHPPFVISTMSQPPKPTSVAPGERIRLAEIDPRRVEDDWTKKRAAKQIEKNTAATADLAYRLYAENCRALLLILQGMDTSGKDGTIRHVMTGVNPQSCQVVPFKQPSHEELDHDFLWRIHRAAPRRGDIGIFNRSQYEDVLVVRVHNLVPEAEWRTRYDRINEFEQLLVDGGVTILKCFLHVSKEEQRERLQARLDDATKRWKFSKGDLAERKLWDDYQRAYEDALTLCNTPHAPWHIIPADRKWYRNLLVSQLLRETLEELDPQIPPAEEGLEGITVE
jgi:PPK2 family polyphosphate:nucleotide phosphotransferase